MTDDDAVDLLIEFANARGASREFLRWDAFVAMWTLATKDFASDYVWWCATGRSLRGNDHGPVTSYARALARAFLAKNVPEIRLPEPPEEVLLS